MSPPISTERVLSTLNEDGTRHWISPRLARGRFLRHRRIVGYALIGLFVAMPFFEIGGRPVLLIDLVSREISVFGALFRPTDGLVLMMLGLTIALSVFLLTALFGRVWCGWGCPQTVYLEHVFRPIERWLEGTSARQARLSLLHPRRIAKWGIYAAVCFGLANVFLAYFVGPVRLHTWVLESPLDHLGGFGVVLGVTSLMLFDFGWFREQMCIVTCPYGRLQSVLLDRQSLIVGYDRRRGEPRAKPKKRLRVIENRGDCVDCGACVDVCPTGIDIRDGLQMECIGCAQCIDACDTVMDKVGKPRNLIGYSSQDQLAGKPRRVLRVRTVAYPVLLAMVTGLLLWSVGARATTEIWVERITGPSFVVLPDGRIASQVRLKLENMTDEPHAYGITLVGAPDARLRVPMVPWRVAGHASSDVPLFVDLAPVTLDRGKRTVSLQIDDDAGFQRTVAVTLLGPEGGAR
jgi:cytochrome c oxidase accessory protein FixG